MRSLAHIKKELQILGANRRALNSSETRALIKILHKNETIIGFLYGIFEAGSPAIMVATKTRLLYVNKTPGNLVVDDIPHDMLASVEYNTGVFWGKVTVFSRSRVYNFTFVPKATVEPFVEVVEELMHSRSRDNR